MIKRESSIERKKREQRLTVIAMITILGIVVLGNVIRVMVISPTPGPSLEELREERFRYEAERAYDAAH